jgi:hypothetical protein
MFVMMNNYNLMSSLLTLISIWQTTILESEISISDIVTIKLDTSLVD